jgi:hypothetical protein
MKVYSQIHALTTSPTNESLTPIGQEAGWAPELVWIPQRRKKSLFLPRIKPQFTGHPAGSLVIILIELSQLLRSLYSTSIIIRMVKSIGLDGKDMQHANLMQTFGQEISRKETIHVPFNIFCPSKLSSVTQQN